MGMDDFLTLQVRWDYLAATDKGYFPYHVDDLESNEAVSWSWLH